MGTGDNPGGPTVSPPVEPVRQVESEFENANAAAAAATSAAAAAIAAATAAARSAAAAADAADAAAGAASAPTPKGPLGWVYRGIVDLRSKPRPIATVIYVVVVAGLLVLGAWLLKAGAKDLTAMATAVGGLVTVMVGLMLARDAGQLLYDRERRGGDSAAEKVAKDLGAAQKAVNDAATADGTQTTKEAVEAGLIKPIDLNTLLPRLITTAAGLAVALVLLGMIMLIGASAAAQPSASASPSATPSAEVTPTPSTVSASPSATR